MQMWESIRRLVSSGSTILLTTQYLDEADQLADRIALIDHGRVVAEGTPRELKAAIGRATLHLQLADEKDAAEAIHVTQNVLNVKASTPEPTLVTAPMADPDRLTDLLVSLREAKIHLATVSVAGTDPRRSLPGADRRWEADGEGSHHAMTAQIVPGGQRRLKNRVTLRMTISNSLTMAYRNLLLIRRTPQQLFDVTIQPILFTLHVRIPLRRCDLRQRERLPADNHPRHPGPDGPDGIHGNRRSAPGGHGQGGVLSFQVDAHRPDCPSHRTPACRHRPLRDCHEPDVRHGLPPRIPLGQPRRSRGRRRPGRLLLVVHQLDLRAA